MVKMEDAVIARFEHSGHKFEILVDPNLALDLKHGKSVELSDLLAMDAIYKDANKGEEASEEIVKKVFGTTELKEVVSRIIKNGEVQLTTEQRRQMLEQKRKEIIAFISNNALNPQTKAPHPPLRIENAMNEARIQVDVFQSAQEQIPEILKEIKKIIPISLEKLKVAVKVPAEFAGKAMPVIHKYHASKQEWQSNGSLVAIFELPVGLKNELFNELNHLTHGNVEAKILEN
ncbi:MAG: ribosome assembly factor SBDS [Candidatus Diapherotrites archaeon]|uniref:Ribosome assembly factor SBDS n=1 Tax=Candidatus Iainarchaeum sp. TaxID=3101447 RepID=A0A7J4K061_9ARCH|nr:ribosome assembly factor SBDS [Candidatus Diapherotrites archaeon]HIH21905.1 ribosome assembly factor SBDS [Candidatus Diapherotrites archaeon]